MAYWVGCPHSDRPGENRLTYRADPAGASRCWPNRVELPATLPRVVTIPREVVADTLEVPEMGIGGQMVRTTPTRRPAALPAALGGLAMSYFLPSVLVLPTFWRLAPRGSPAGLCRWRTGSPRHELALTFDDGPDRNTPQTLDLLDDLGLQATFFLLGSQ